MTGFDALKRLYEDNRFVELLQTPDGLYWLKLRSLSRTEHLNELCVDAGIVSTGVPNRGLLAYVYSLHPPEEVVDGLIRRIYERERAERAANENYLISELYKMKVLDWGGLYQNSLEQTIVDNYVKRIMAWDDLNRAIQEQLVPSMQGYVQASWYNHWSSIIIEDVFKDHPNVLPAVGLIKKVDFFIHGIPFDLKVTYFPAGYMKVLRQSKGLRPEFTLLKAFCRERGIWFDNAKPEGELFSQLLAMISEYPSDDARSFTRNFNQTRMDLIHETIAHPRGLATWLYENQGVRRFDASNRFFLVLVDTDNLEESWKLKRNRPLLAEGVGAHLDGLRPEDMNELRLEFQWEDKVYEVYADTLFVLTSRSK